ncbi:MAG: hypothetical protein ACREDT_03520 [Methylocella sp.]
MTNTPIELDGRQEPAGGGGGGGGPQARSPQNAAKAGEPPADKAISRTAHILIEQLNFFIFSSQKKLEVLVPVSAPKSGSELKLNKA